MPSTVAMPRAAADPVRNEVRAVSATSSAPTAPIGMAMAQPVTRPAMHHLEHGRIVLVKVRRALP